MLGGVHESIRAMLQQALGDRKANVVFGPPVSMAAQAMTPTVGLWLADIREDKTGRMSDWQPTQGDDGTVSGWGPPLRNYRLTYVLSVVADSYELEIETIGELLRSMGAVNGLPKECRRGWLTGESDQVRVAVADPPYSITEGLAVWSSLGLPARTAISLVLTVPVRSDHVEEAGLPVVTRRLSVEAEFAATTASEVLEPARRDSEVASRKRGAVREG
jgi:hypothetical protein